MLLKTCFVDGLLGNHIASAKEDTSGDGLGEQGPAGQLSLVPRQCAALASDVFCSKLISREKDLPPKHLGV